MANPEESNWLHKWLPARSRETPDGEVYCLPMPVDGGIRELFRLTADEAKAEDEFRACCIAQASSLGFWNEQWISYGPLKSAHRVPQSDSLSHFLDLGWEQCQIDRLAADTMKVNEIVSGMPSMAGRMLTSPEFLRQRDDLRAQWIKLPVADRPGFPLLRSPSSSEALPDTSPAPLNDPLVEFTRAFDAFCDRWETVQLATWNHPLPRGPQWPALAPHDRNAVSTSTLLSTPSRFPLSSNDGVGTIHQCEHAAMAADSEIVDIERWETYGRLLQIDHWDRVLTVRYLDRKRPRNHVTVRTQILAGHLGLDGERIVKLRKLLNALKSGRRKTLRGWR